MKKPNAQGWIAIIGALAALLITLAAALSDRIITSEEATALTDKTQALVDTVQSATADAPTADVE